MIPRLSLSFVPSAEAIREPVTKFGGQPVWLADPCWPVGADGEPQRFVGQVRIEPGVFGEGPSELAYVFVDGGKGGAVVLQPGRAPTGAQDLTEGPTLSRSGKPAEYAVKLRHEDDPEHVSEDDREEWDEDQLEAYEEELEGNKIGGAPLFVAGDAFPDGRFWHLLLQIDSGDVPFELGLAGDGVLYAFLSEEGREGRVVWQGY